MKSHTSNEFTLDLIYQEIVDTDDCINNQCAEGSTCVDQPFRYTCDCPTGKGGRYCEGTHKITYEFFTVYTKLAEVALLYSEDLTTSKKDTFDGARPDERDYYWRKSPMSGQLS